MKTLSVFLVMVTLIVGLVSCVYPPPYPDQYNLTSSSTEGGSVTTPGEGTFTYYDMDVVELVAEPDEGYHFVEWTGDVTNVASVEDATTTITMDNHYSITANFAYGPAIPLKNPGRFVQMTIGDPYSLDPAWVYDYAGGEQVQYVYETLLFYDGEEIDQFVPVLATEWELLVDNVSYRFKIREGVKFHEGGDLTPEDVEYSFERAMVQDRSGGPIWTLYQPLLGGWSNDDAGLTFADIDGAVEVDGDYVVFTLEGAWWQLAFLQILCGPWASIVDKEWCIANGDWDGTEETWETYKNPQNPGDTVLFNKTNGTGPWKLEEWDPGVQIKMVRNDDYWREPAAFESVITQIEEDWTTRKESLLAGNADLVYVSPPWTSWNSSRPEDVEELEGIVDLNIYKDLPELVNFGLFFNMAIHPDSTFVGSGALDGDGIPPDFFTDIDVRKGFCYAFDYETYMEDGWLGEAQRLGSPVCESLPYFNPNASMYSLDRAKAEEHLQAAWDGEAWEKGFEFTLLYVTGNLRREAACRILAENLCAINPKFHVSTQPIAFETYVSKMVQTRDMPMFAVGWIADYPHPDNFVVPSMASYGAFAEWQRYGDSELDELIEGAFKELDPTVQKDLYYGLQERYYQDAPSIMLCQPLVGRYFTKYIDGFYFNPMIPGRAGPLYYMSKWES